MEFYIRYIIYYIIFGVLLFRKSKLNLLFFLWKKDWVCLDENIKYYYNEDGIRVRKIVGSDVVEYHLEGSKIVFETRGSDKLYYIRDEADGLIGIVFNRNMYCYKKSN